MALRPMESTFNTKCLVLIQITKRPSTPDLRKINKDRLFASGVIHIFVDTH